MSSEKDISTEFLRCLLSGREAPCGLDRVYTCTTPKAAPTLSLEYLMEAKALLDAMKPPDTWVLIDPEGKVFQGTAQDIATQLVRDGSVFIKHSA